MRLIILQQGFVYVAEDPERLEHGELRWANPWCILRIASTLDALACDGPHEMTVIRCSGAIRTHELCVVLQQEVSQDAEVKWRELIARML